MVTETGALTERQQEVLALVKEGVGAREIGLRLGITRNAVYQQINRLKKHGQLPDGRDGQESTSSDKTPPSATERALVRVTSDGTTSTNNREAPLSAQLLTELARVQQLLAAEANRLERYLR